MLWHNTASPDGSITYPGDWVSSSAYGFTPVGSTFLSSTGLGVFSFDIKDALNADLGAGSAWSSYTLTHNGLPTAVLPKAQYMPVPEPATVALFGIGLLTLAAGYRLRRRRKQS
jgi:hypothetical protein